VIGDHDSRVGRLTSENYVATLLTLNNESDFRESLDETLPGKISGQSSHYEPRVTSTYSRLSSTGIGSPAA
jgi:hypothetical protein